MSGFRVVMTVTEEASPELYAALRGVPTRLRAERVRTLAAIGLTALSGAEAQNRALTSGGSGYPHEKTAPSGPARAVNFARSLAGGV